MNEIHPSISMTIDFQANHISNKMPILDLELWIRMVDVNGSKQPNSLYSVNQTND